MESAVIKNQIITNNQMKNHMSRNEYIELIRKQHKRKINQKSYDMNFQNIIKFPNYENSTIKKNENKSSSNDKKTVKNNNNNNIIHKKTLSSIINLNSSPFKFKSKNIIKYPVLLDFIILLNYINNYSFIKPSKYL